MLRGHGAMWGWGQGSEDTQSRVAQSSLYYSLIPTNWLCPLAISPPVGGGGGWRELRGFS